MVLYVCESTGNSRMSALKAMREAGATPGLWNAPKGLSAAHEVWKTIADDGFAFFGESDDSDALLSASSILRGGGLLPYVFDSHEEAGSKMPDKAARAAGLTPEETFARNAPGEAAPSAPSDLTAADYKAAIAFLVAAQGHTVNACSQALALSQAIGSVDLAAGVIAAISQVYPQLPDALAKLGYIAAVEDV